MKRRLLKVAKWVGYPLFYLFCLLFFLYATFPFDQLRDRVIAEFDRAQAKSKTRRPGEAPMKLQIDELDGYWVTGVELTGVRLILPPKPERPGAKKKPGGFPGFNAPKPDAAEEESPPKPAELVVDHATARVRFWSLLVGDVVIDFEADAFGGTIEGTVPAGAGGDVDVKFDGVQLGQIAPLQEMLDGIPLFGLASGSIQLSPREKKFSKADGNLSVRVDGLKIGKKTKGKDGKFEDVVSIQGIKIPSIQAGSLVIEGPVKSGLLTFSEFAGRGRDFELIGEGKLKLADVWDRSTIDAFLKFKFTDSYRESSDATISLLGKPGAGGRPLIEMPGSPLGRAKADEGFYRFQLKGPLGRLKPRAAGTAAGRNPRRNKKGLSTQRNKPRPRRPARMIKRDEDEKEEKDEKEEEREEKEPEPPEEQEREPPPIRKPASASNPSATRLRAMGGVRPSPRDEVEPDPADGSDGADDGSDPAGDPGDDGADQ